MFGVVQILIFGSVWISVTCQLPECMAPRCSCCKDKFCRSDDFCTNGCIDGVWSNRCYSPCPDNCVTCTQGSQDGGSPCTSCITSKYGDYCEQYCAAGCDGGTCNIDGRCSCIAGYSGDKCDTVVFVCPDKCLTCTSSLNCQTCVDGYYNGYRWSSSVDFTYVCKHPCRQNCKACTGYNLCIQCVDGFYGQYCQDDCSSGCQSGTCDKDTSHCNCKSDFRGNKCDHCIAGKYSDDCNKLCLSQNCNNNVCIRDSGRCLTCSDGYYGSTLCDQSCSTSCKYGMCDFTTGTCTSGCSAGYSGDKCCLNNNNCDTCSSNTQCQICKSGYSGDKCCVNSYHCETCSSSFTCSNCENRYSGDMCCVNNDKCVTCLSGQTCSRCVDGYSGDKCCLQNTYCETCLSSSDCSICVAGRYGNLCQHQCDDKCITCTSATNCTSCISGYYGIVCTDLCPNNCIECTTSTSCKACKPGFKGTYCHETCNNCKPGSHCDQNTGYCDECIDGKNGNDCNSNCYYPDCLACKRYNRYTCTECKVGKYKLNNRCTFNCPSNNCLDHKCDVDTGECPACKNGFHGVYCQCPVNCKTCYTNGACQTCIAGYGKTNKQCECRQDKCSTPGCDQCNDITWYPDVNKQLCCQCSSNCKGGQCVSDTECAAGCEGGYYGNACDKLCSSRDTNCLQCTSNDNDNNYECSKCSQGFYPEMSRCQVCYSNCKNNSCDQSSGICLQGCKNGFWGETCESSCSETCLTCNQVTGECEVCKGGKFTTDCTISCSIKCMVSAGEELNCRINDGACLTGCISTKLYGLKCNEDCSSNCQDGTCEWQSGKCLTCIANKYGPICGDECINNCVTNAQDGHLTRCFGENGTCTFGCISGFYGFKCEDVCSQYCSNTTCGRLNGECLHGCMEGYKGGTCTQALVSSDPVPKQGPWAAIGGAVGGIVVVFLIVIAVVFLVRRRRGSNSKHPSTHSNDEIQNKPKDMSDPVHSYYNTNESAPETETTHEYEELDVVPQNMQRSGLSADHHGDSDVIETGDVNTYEPLNRPEINTDVYSQLKHSAYENTTI